MEIEEITPHIEEIKRVLNEKVDDEELIKEFRKYTETYRMSPEEAKRGIIRKHGGPTIEFVTADAVVKKIGDLTGNEQNVDIVAKVLTSEKREINARGSVKKIVSVFIGDDTGKTSLTIWDGNADLEKGETYRFKGCYSKKWNDRVQLNLGQKGAVERSDVKVDVINNMQSEDTTLQEKKIGDLTGNEPNVNIVAKVVYVEKKDITVKGVPKNISSGIIGDESGSASFTVWENPPELEKGAVYRFNGCYTRKWNDKVQINIGQRGTITRADDVKIDLPERNLSLSVSEIKIGEIKENSGSVTVTGRILTSESRQVTVKGEPKTVYSGLIADDTGKIQFSAWNDYGLKEGETVCVKNAYIRSWQGIPQLNLGDRCEVCRVDDTFDDTAIGTSTERTIGDILKNGGGLDITLRGTVVDIKAGSGLIKRCPICNRSILDTGCSAHGMQDEPIPDLRMKLSVDDGTGSISAIMNRDITEKLTDITLKMAIDLSKARGPGMVATEMAPKILMKRIKIRGNVKIDDFGPTMIVTEAEPDKVDIEAEATKLLKEVEAKI